MYYRREKRRRRLDQDFMEEQTNRAPKRKTGVRYTFLSFFCIALCLAVVKASNPDMSMRSPVLLFMGVLLSCIIMYRVGNRKK